MRNLRDFCCSGFGRGMLCGIVLVILLLLSWRFVLILLACLVLWKLCVSRH